MKVAVLFSGGKDSGLVALLLEPFFDEIELVTFSFGHDDAWTRAADAARELDLPHRKVVFEDSVLEKALKMLLYTGYPNDALNYVHPIAVETLAKECEFVADGTRRDDRAPKMGFSAVRSLEDRLHMQYLRPWRAWVKKPSGPWPCTIWTSRKSYPRGILPRTSRWA